MRIIAGKILIFFLLTGWTSVAQVKLVPSSHIFMPTDELQKDSVSLTIVNNFPFDLDIISVTGFKKFESNPFSVSDSSFLVQANGMKSIWIYFNPDQNVWYDQEIVLNTFSRGSLSIDLKGQGKYADSYYSSTENKSEESLKTAINSLLALNYYDLGYTGARDKMYGSIDNVNGDVECVYTGRTATFNTRSGANSNNFNCEHTWPQSLFNSATPMKSDIHHLFPTDVTSNSKRGSYPFGLVTGTPTWTVGGSKLGNGVFEPRDIHKGTCARAMMYFTLRYQNYSSFMTNQESLLRDWHEQYPPSSFDIQRNNDIYLEQNNRNPFVDYPQILKRINSLSSTSTAPVVDSLFVSADTIWFQNEVNGDSLIYNLVVTNAGNQPCNLQSISYTQNIYFEILDNFQNDTLAPGASKNIRFFMMKPLPNAMSFSILTSHGNHTGYVYSTAGLDLDYWIAQRILIYPNPTIDHLRLFAPVTENLSFQLIDGVGNIVMNGTFRGSVSIDTRSLRWGNYYLKISRNSVLHVEQIIVTKSR